MDSGLYIAATGMMTEMVRQDQLASDLANASTPGYKPDRTTQREFGKLLLVNVTTGQAVGELGFGVTADGVHTDTAPRPLRDTGEPLDFAIAGDGWFAVRTPQGVRYTRNGQFAASPQGTLVTPLGQEVLDQQGRPVRVGADGRVDPRALGVFALRNPVKQGDSLVSGAVAGQAAGTVRAGALEASGVDPARAMIDMIASMRAFEAGQRVITTIDGTLGKAANQVGSLSS
jgi:flagellar basal-body rod protein FlgG